MQKFHEGSDGNQMGFPSSVYRPLKKRSFYADQAYEIWKYLRQKNIITYDILVKRVQLMDVVIPCTVLLVDECQDMDGCQVEWMKNQAKFGKFCFLFANLFNLIFVFKIFAIIGTHVFFVGDAAQTIYSFRGARVSFFSSSNSRKFCPDTCI